MAKRNEACEYSIPVQNCPMHKKCLLMKSSRRLACAMESRLTFNDAVRGGFARANSAGMTGVSSTFIFSSNAGLSSSIVWKEVRSTSLRRNTYWPSLVCNFTACPGIQATTFPAITPPPFKNTVSHNSSAPTIVASRHNNPQVAAHRLVVSMRISLSAVKDSESRVQSNQARLKLLCRDASYLIKR